MTGLTSGVAGIAVAGGHACAVTTAGGAKCWGENLSGQLGDGTTTGRLTPVDVTGLTSGVASVSAGGELTCAVTTAGGAKCWGENPEGQLGDNTTISRSTAADVTGLTSGVAAISVSGDYTCARMTSGGIKCWGDNIDGQLGDGTTTNRLTAVDVSGLTSGVGTLSVGGDHVCVITTAGGAKCWGDNGDGQVGDGTVTSRLTSVDVIGLTSGVVAVGTGSDHSCFVVTSGAVKCTGDNAFGQLGTGTIVWSTVPVDVIGLQAAPPPPAGDIVRKATSTPTPTAASTSTSTAAPPAKTPAPSATVAQPSPMGGSAGVITGPNTGGGSVGGSSRLDVFFAAAMLAVGGAFAAAMGRRVRR